MVPYFRPLSLPLKEAITVITASITRDKGPDCEMPPQKMGARSFVAKYGCVLAKNEVRATDLRLCACVPCGRHRKKRLVFGRLCCETPPASPRWGLKTVSALKSLHPLHLLCTKNAFTNISRPGSLMHIHLLPLTLPATVDSSAVYGHTQQRRLMSRNAHRSVKRHDRCRCGGSLLLGGCCSLTNGAPRLQTMAGPAPPAAAEFRP